MIPTNTVGDPYLPDADDVNLEQVQNEFPLSCSMTKNINSNDDILTYEAILVKNALTLVSLWCKAHALAIDAQSAQSC